MRVALFAMSLALAMQSSAARKMGSLSVHGPVRVDGAIAGNGAALFTGQTVRTEAQSTARLVLADDLEVILMNDSEMRVEAAGPVLARGAAEFTSRKKKAVFHVARLRIQPAEETAVAASTLARERLRLAVRSGAVVVTDPGGQVLASVVAGQAALFGLAAEEQKSAARPKGRSGGQAPELAGRRSGGQAPGLPPGQAAVAAPGSGRSGGRVVAPAAYVRLPDGPAAGQTSTGQGR